MTESHYLWEPGEKPPEIQQHSVAKHKILRAYLLAYFQTLISNPNQEEFRLALVDGFAGGGVYQHAATGDEILGSPFIMLDTVQEAEVMVNQGRHKPVRLNLDYYFVEKHRGAALFLGEQLKGRGYGGLIGRNVFVQNSTFDEQADSIIEYVKRKSPRAARAIFLLDQYGYSKVPTETIRKIITSMPGSEVILTFAVDALLTYVTDEKGATQTLLNKMGVPEVLRGRTIEDIKSKEPDWRLFIQSCLYKDLVSACGAKYYTLFFIRSDKGHGDYWLIHFSQRARARDVMTRVHWDINNTFAHYGGAGMDMFNVLGYASKQDESYTGQMGLFFDDSAKELSISALMEQIPPLIYPDPGGMTFGELFSSSCNYSPASSTLYRQAIGKLVDIKEVEVEGEGGIRRRSANQIHDSDHVMAPRQRRFFF